MNFESNSYSKFVKGIDNIEKVTPTYDQFIIKPPERNKTHGRIGVKLIIDSRDRDLILYPDTNDYVYKCPEEFKDVISAELVLADFPNSGYNIYSKNNEMIFNAGGQQLKIKVPFGEYVNSSLLSVLNGSKGDLFKDYSDNGIYFNFSMDTNNNRIKIQSNRSFSFNLDYTVNNRFFSRNGGSRVVDCHQGDIDNYYESIQYYSIDRTLGFNRHKHDSQQLYSTDTCDPDFTDISGTVMDISGTSTSGYDLYEVDISGSGFDARKIYSVGDYIEMENGEIYRITEIVNKNIVKVENFQEGSVTTGGVTIQAYNSIFSDNVFDIECPQYVVLDIPEFHYLKAQETSINEAFAIIPFRPGCKTVIDSASVSIDKEIKFFNPPLARLANIRIKFLRYDGTLYDFKGRNHVFALKITTLNQPGYYNNYVPTN